MGEWFLGSTMTHTCMSPSVVPCAMPRWEWSLEDDTSSYRVDNAQEREGSCVCMQKMSFGQDVR